ncbi:MAG: hypothetical protein CMJ31_00110 [Phycisphaerae bacterium]|nr:hypothetical protein [Phycisphaerae bacterium]
MEAFEYRQGDLYCENVQAMDIATRFGTPTLVYSAHALTTAAKRYHDAFGAIGVGVMFSVKSCPTIGCLRRIAKAGLGMCATSGADLERAWLSRAPMTSVMLAGVAKTDDDIRAALDGIYSPLFQGGVTLDGRPPYYRGPIGWFIAESHGEIERIARVAKGLRINCRVALRVRLPSLAPPVEGSRGVDSKFGMPAATALDAFDRYRDLPNVSICGLHTHLGPVATTPERHAEAAKALSELAREAKGSGHSIELIDLGGGFAPIGVSGTAPTPERYAEAIEPAVKWAIEEGIGVVVEPGSAIATAAATLLVRVLDAKPLEDRVLLITDGGLSSSDANRRADAVRVVWPASVDPGKEPPREDTERIDPRGMHWYDVTGPTGWDDDAIAGGRLMPPVDAGGVLAVFSMGASPQRSLAYDHATSLPAEVIVDGLRPTLLRTKRDMCDRIAAEAVALDTSVE